MTHTVSKRTRAVTELGTSKKPRLGLDLRLSAGETCASLPVQFNDDLLLMLFSWLDGRALLTCLSVCRRWRAVGMVDSLWKALIASEFGASFRLMLAAPLLSQIPAAPKYGWKHMYHRCRRFLIRKCHVKSCYVYAEVAGRGNLKVCADCRAVSYCSKDHQRLDWRASHRTQCTELSRTRMFDPDPCMRDARLSCPLCADEAVTSVTGAKHIDYFCTGCRLFSARVPHKRRPSELGQGLGQGFVQVGAMLPGGGNVMVGVGGAVQNLNLPPNLLAGAMQAALGAAAAVGGPGGAGGNAANAANEGAALGAMLVQALMNVAPAGQVPAAVAAEAPAASDP